MVYRRLLLAACVLATGCSSVADEAAGGDETTLTTATLESTTAPPSNESIADEPDRLALVDPTTPETAPFDYSSVGRDLDTTPTTSATGARDSSNDGETGTSAGGSNPQTPSPASAAPPADVMSLYRGVLGTYGPTDVLAVAPAPLPTVTPGTAPLTGRAPAPPQRPAVIVKIDNSSKARPQSGLNLADVVVEQEVEWGLTRFAAIFHTNSVARVGPVRSVRSTDISFVNSLGQPALAYSGANEVFEQLIRRQATVQNFSAARNGGYWRDSSRKAPSNLYTDTGNFDGAGLPPGAWFDYSSSPVSAGIAQSEVKVSFPNTSILWTWNGTAWLRRQDNKKHTTDGGAQVAATNVVVVEVGVVDTGMKDPAGSVVPEFVWVGSGRASVFVNGRRIDGRWTRPRLVDPAVLTTDAGEVIELMPGNTWVEMVRSLP